jgi:hypothetical protein
MLLAQGVAVHIGGIEEGDAGIQGGCDDLRCAALVDAPAEIVAANSHERDRQGPDPAMLHANSV